MDAVIKRDYAIPFYNNGFDERYPRTYLTKSEMARLNAEMETYDQAKRQELVNKARDYRENGEFMVRNWWYDYYSGRPRVPVPVIPTNDGDAIAVAYWRCLREELHERYDKFLRDCEKWRQNYEEIETYYRDYETWRNTSWWNRTFKQSPPKVPYVIDDEECYQRTGRRYPLRKYSGISRRRIVNRAYMLRQFPARLVDEKSDLFKVHSEEQIEKMTEQDWKRLFDRAIERAMGAAPIGDYPIPQWQKELCEARRPIPMAQVYTREFIRGVREDKIFLTQKVPAYLRANLGLPVEAKRPLGPFIYATVFLPDIGQIDKPWLYIGKRLDPTDHEYLGSGRALRGCVENYGAPFFQRYIVTTLPASATADDLAEAEERILRRFEAKQDKRLFNLVNT